MADEGLNYWMLPEHLEEEFNLPMVTINLSDGRRSDAKTFVESLITS